jgi:hypothetical protein
VRSCDNYVNDTVNAIMGSQMAPSWSPWDEDDFAATNLGCWGANPGGGHVATIVIGNHRPRGVQDAAACNHYTLLQTIEDAFHLGCLRNTCDTSNVVSLAPPSPCPTRTVYAGTTEPHQNFQSSPATNALEHP